MSIISSAKRLWHTNASVAATLQLTAVLGTLYRLEVTVADRVCCGGSTGRKDRHVALQRRWARREWSAAVGHRRTGDQVGILVEHRVQL